jgi:hypothetical protein
MLQSAALVAAWTIESMELRFMKRILVSLSFAAVAIAARADARPSVALAVASRMSIGLPVSASMAGLPAYSQSAIAINPKCAAPLPDLAATSRGISKYMACLKMDTVCGEHFESCDTRVAFNSKKVFCLDKLQECTDEAINSLYGVAEGKTAVETESKTMVCDGETKVESRSIKGTATSLASFLTTFEPANSSMIDQAMKDGAGWVAGHSVSACISVADSCIKRACAGSAFKCVTKESLTDDTYTELGSLVSADGTAAAATAFRVDPGMLKQYINAMTYTAENVRNYLKGQCKTEIGTNKSCYTIVNGAVPKDDSWTVEDFEINTIYSDVMTGQLNRLNANQHNIYEWLAAGSWNALQSCRGTVEACVKNACGAGSLAACYGMATQDGASSGAHIESADFSGYCSGIVASDQNCKDLFGEGGQTAAQLWGRIWGSAADQWAGQFDLVGKLNAELTNMFSETSVRQTRQQCQAEAEACVKRECGGNFADCYVNDVFSLGADPQDAYGKTSFGGANADGQADASSTALGGYDEKMAIRLCMIPVKKSQVCQDHFDIQYARNNGMKSLDSWSTSFSARSNWAEPGKTMYGEEICTSANTYQNECAADEAGKETCSDVARPVCAAQELNIFRNLIADIGQEARAKLTREQNVLKNSCEARGGTGAYWAKKPSKMIDILKTYATKGFGAAQTPTRDVWGAFCQIKVDMIVKNDMAFQIENEKGTKFTIYPGADISKVLAGSSDAYFSRGDTVSCGSWLPQSKMDGIVNAINNKAAEQEESSRDWWHSDRNASVVVGLVSAAVGGVGGGFAGNALGKTIAGLTGGESSEDLENVNTAIAQINECIAKVNGFVTTAKTMGIERTGSTACNITAKNRAGNFQTIIVYDFAHKNSATSVKDENTKDISDRGPIDQVEQLVGYLTQLNDLLAAQEEKKATINASSDDREKKGGLIGTGIGVGVGAIGGGLIGGLMTQSAIDKANELNKVKMQNTALAQWFDSITAMIRCSDGQQEVGYGESMTLK